MHLTHMLHMHTLHINTTHTTYTDTSHRQKHHTPPPPPQQYHLHGHTTHIDKNKTHTCHRSSLLYRNKGGFSDGFFPFLTHSKTIMCQHKKKITLRSGKSMQTISIDVSPSWLQGAGGTLGQVLTCPSVQSCSQKAAHRTQHTGEDRGSYHQAPSRHSRRSPKFSPEL